jgi:alpha-mannosidase
VRAGTTKFNDATLDNGLISLTVDQADGTFSINDLQGLDRLVDDGDEGDTYNYSPPAGDAVVDRPAAVAVEVLERGPVRGRVRVTRTFVWPHRIEDGKRVGSRTVDVATELELRAGEEMVRVTTTLENQCRDHRLRAWFPLPRLASESRAECAFGTVTRGLVAEGGEQEYGLPTFPSRRFVSAGGLTVLHDGLLEYEVVDSGRALALTLLRATGMLSRDHAAYRPNPAGPALPVEGPQMQGRLTVRYALCVGREQDAYALADQAWLPFEVTAGAGIGNRPDRGSVLSVTGAEVSAVQRVGGVLEVRVFNPSDGDTTVTVDGSGWLVDLRGRPLEPFDGSFELRPWGIATARLSGSR